MGRMSLRPVSLADVLISFAALKPETDEARQGIAKALGFDFQPAPKPPEEVAPEKPASEPKTDT